MPSYNYKCKDCGAAFSVTHSIKETQGKCSECPSVNVMKTVAPFLANTETSFDAKTRHYEEQAHKDIARFHKDDKFADNITGQSDKKSITRQNELIAKEQKKQDLARTKIKRLDPK